MIDFEVTYPGNNPCCVADGTFSSLSETDKFILSHLRYSIAVIVRNRISDEAMIFGFNIQKVEVRFGPLAAATVCDTFQATALSSPFHHPWSLILSLGSSEHPRSGGQSRPNMTLDTLRNKAGNQRPTKLRSTRPPLIWHANWQVSTMPRSTMTQAG